MEPLEQNPATEPATQAGQALDEAAMAKKDLIVKQALSHILKPETMDAIISKAQNGDPKQAVLDAVSPLLQSVYDTATESGAQVSMLVMLVAGIEVIGNVAEMLGAAGVIPSDEKAVAMFAAEVGKMAVEEHNQRVGGGGQQPAPGGAPQPAAPGGMMAGPAPTGA